MIPNVDSAAQQLPALRVGSGDDQVLTSHQIPLEARGYQTVDVLAGRNEDLTGQMSALLATV